MFIYILPLKDVYDENKILREQLAAYASVEVNTNVLSNERN